LDFLVLELAAAVEDECFAVSEEVLLLAADVEAEAVGWLEEVAAEARRAMLRAKRAVSFMLLGVVVVLLFLKVCGRVWWKGLMGELLVGKSIPETSSWFLYFWFCLLCVEFLC
jgi:hypothetical protein